MLKSKFFGLFMTIELLSSIVWCNAECKDDNVVEEVIVPAHYENVGVSYRYYQTSTKRIIKSRTTNCYNVVFPLQNLKRENCENCNTTLKVLSLADITSPVLSKGAISEVPDYNTLILSDLNITKISPGAFGRQDFRKIVLSGNKLTEIELGTFNSLTKLQNIDISFNSLKSLPTHCLLGVPDLKTFNVSNNEFIKFSFDILDVSVTKIELIDLSYNIISILNRDNKIRVDKLYLSNNRIKTFKFCPFEFLELNLSHNFLEFLNVENCDVDTNENKLKVLDVGFNSISKLEQFYFENASNLEYLYLNHNNISEIATGVFFNLNNLILLNLSGNHLREFQHGTFDSLQNLMVLDLSSNRLNSIKTSLHALISLKELYLQNNNIASIDTKQLMYNSKNLQKISFNNNNFSCESLVEVFYYLRSYLNITNGINRNTSNIHGIACSDAQNFESSQYENIKNDLENVIFSMFKEKKNKNSEDKDDLKEYFNDFEKNSFKYFESLRNQNKAEPAKLMDFQKFENRNATNIIIIILVCISCILISISNFLIWKVYKNKSNRGPDEVEMLQD